MAETPPQRNTDRRALCARLREVLLSAAGHRRERDETIPGLDGHLELGWMVYEREQMLAAVNAEREVLGFPPVGADVIASAELQACGHSDYVSQWVWRCADLVLAGDVR